ncbi:hypothetical protein JRQ81_020144 [Phrynocephalus forsythii]|uniref:exo-alpha-sialidase n=1 Tax=Phrynocephalus forsythii TaxID=171643 RepID=A0A9Q1AYZ8_9SAUR|nr:hypothetical protein JRQ81_020144 [Phrynocephalus forsythii]
MSEPQAGSGKVTLFRQAAPGGLTYRIPALLYLPSQSAFLAFAEKRASFRDEHAEFLVMRRGQKDGSSVQWGPVEALETAMLPGHRTMNPCPVYDRTTGTVFLFFISVQTHISEWHQIQTGMNAARLCCVTSQDGGRTWSPATDLTERAIGEELSRWATFAVGPGHGVQLSSGRLVVPAYAYYIHKRSSGDKGSLQRIPIASYCTVMTAGRVGPVASFWRVCRPPSAKWLRCPTRTTAKSYTAVPAVLNGAGQKPSPCLTETGLRNPICAQSCVSRRMDAKEAS